MQILLNSYCFQCIKTICDVLKKVYEGSKLSQVVKVIQIICANSYFGRLGHFYEEHTPLFETSVIRKGFLFVVEGICKKIEDIRKFLRIPKLEWAEQQYEVLTYVLAGFAFVDYIFRNYIVSFSSVWDELFLIVAFLFWAWKGIRNRGNEIWRSTPLHICIFVFVGVFGVLTCLTENMQIAIEGLRALVQYVLWFFATIQLLNGRFSVKNLLKIFVCVTGVLGVHGIWQYITKVEMPETWVESSESVRTRVFSIFTSPNVFGSLLVLAIPIAISLMFVEKSWRHKAVCGIIALAMLGALVFTYSRGAWLGFCVAVFVYVLIKDRRLIALVATLGVAVLAFVPSISNRLLFMFSGEYLASSMQGGRLIRWLTAIDIIKEHPLIGVGIGKFGGAVAMNHDLSVVVQGQRVDTFYMDNNYLKIGVESGILGLSIFLWLMYQVFVTSVKTIGITRDAYMKEVAIGILAGLSGVMFHNCVENVFEVPMMVSLFWMLVGVMMYIWYMNYYALKGGNENVEN